MASLLILASCATKQEKDDFDYTVESFADLEILRYKVPGFEELSLKQKELVYYLSEAAAYGRDILYDQNGKWNLAIRRTLEAIYQNYTGDRESQDFKNFEVYLKRVWFSNGIHHHYGCDKFVPEFSQEFFTEAVNRSTLNTSSNYWCKCRRSTQYIDSCYFRSLGHAQTSKSSCR